MAKPTFVSTKDFIGIWNDISLSLEEVARTVYSDDVSLGIKICRAQTRVGYLREQSVFLIPRKKKTKENLPEPIKEKEQEIADIYRSGLYTNETLGELYGVTKQRINQVLSKFPEDVAFGMKRKNEIRFAERAKAFGAVWNDPSLTLMQVMEKLDKDLINVRLRSSLFRRAGYSMISRTPTLNVIQERHESRLRIARLAWKSGLKLVEIAPLLDTSPGMVGQIMLRARIKNPNDFSRRYKVTAEGRRLENFGTPWRRSRVSRLFILGKPSSEIATILGMTCENVTSCITLWRKKGHLNLFPYRAQDNDKEPVSAKNSTLIKMTR